MATLSLLTPPNCFSAFYQMEEKNNLRDIEILPDALKLADELEDLRERRDLLVMRVGSACRIAVFADETESVSEARDLTPLPGAPPAVLGVASVRGRMYIVLDPLQLLPVSDDTPSDVQTDDARTAASSSFSSERFFVALRGDEQLALAVEAVERITEIITEEIETTARADNLVRGILATHEPHESATTARMNESTVLILDPAQLFDAAMRGTDRRRNRT